MSPSVEEAKNALLKEHARQVKAKHPKWSFSQCWQAAQASHPELAEEYTTAAEPVYRYTENLLSPASTTAKPLRNHLDEILSERLAERIEAHEL